MSRRVLILSEDPVGEGMGGNAIRAYEIARALAAHAQVTLLAPLSGGGVGDVEHVPFAREDLPELRARLRQADAVLALPQNPVLAKALRRSHAQVIYDLYDPRPLQVLEAYTGARPLSRRLHAVIALDHYMAALATGDNLLCASERQRDLWIGALLSAGLITPDRYASDPSLRDLIDVVPFGLPADPPRHSGPGPLERFPTLASEDELVLWNGGLWNWLDPVGAVQAIARVVARRPAARLVFMGRPPLAEDQARAARSARELARRLGLLDTVVLFNDGWVPYEERGAWLLAGDCAVSMHVEHLETRFSFRTRLLDCLWAGLPVVCTSGDELAERVERERLGASVPPGDPDAAAEAILGVLANGRTAYRDALASAAEDYRWPVVIAPLVRYITAPPASAGSRRGPLPLGHGRWARAAATRAGRVLLRAGRRR